LLFVVSTYPLDATWKKILWDVEVIVVFFFVLEYMARLYGAQNRLKQVINVYSIIDVLAILPTILLLVLLPFGIHINLGFLVVLRAFRVFRFLRFTQDTNFFFGKITWHVLKVVRLIMVIFIIFFISSGLFYHAEYGTNIHVNNFGDAFYFTVVTLTTVGFGDVIPQTEAGRWITVLMIISGIILIPWQAGQVIKEWVHVSKVDVMCKKCGLRHHDKDASHCKACGAVIFQEYDSVD